MINVIGLGYIGLPTALMLAAHGNRTVGTDYNKELVSRLNAGQVTFEENALDSLFQKAVGEGITFSNDYQPADMYIVAVPTPYEERSKKVDAHFVADAVQEILHVCPKGATVVIESTIPPGTIDRYVRPVITASGLVDGQDIHLAHAPERIIPGNMIHELEYNDRTIGADLPNIAEKVKAVYASFCKGNILTTNIRTAEMSKVVENTFRDINIAYANELAKICRNADIDVYEIIRIANTHPRVNILNPGPGVGGHCISVDPWFLVGDYPDLAKLIRTARETNDAMPEYVLERISAIMKETGLDDVSRVGFYGLTYKEDVDDIRESPTLQLLQCMKKHLAHGAKVYDPWVKRTIVEHQYHNFDTFLHDVDMVVILVGHSEIKEKLNCLRDKIILDTRHVCSLPGTYRL